jgi:hypothetical protein
MRWLRYGSMALLCFACGLPQARGEAARELVRGITISTHTNGHEWFSAELMAPTLEEIRGLGAGWVAIHPYAAIHPDGTVRRGRGDASTSRLAEPIRLAHEAGLKILIKPHLAYWGSPFSWRGDIAFEDAADWERFFSSYGEWIVSLARTTHGADGFVVGTELDRTLGFESEWRGIVERVRSVTDVPLTYAANWSDYDQVPFWDAVDVIGIQAYFPLVDAPTDDEQILREAWQARMRDLHAYSELHNRAIVFTELGYSRAFRAAVEPWSSHTDGDDAAMEQERCMRLALAAIDAEPSVLGAFLWKWFPGSKPNGRNFRLSTIGMRRVIADAWAAAPDAVTGMSAE